MEITVSNVACTKGCCYRTWLGKDECIFRLTSSTSAGYEIGWSFTESVVTSGTSFAGFCHTMTNLYKIRNKKASFMNSKTFAKWWFAWASALCLEFRQTCFVCKEEPRRLVSDGTKIGIRNQNSSHPPMEFVPSTSNQETVATLRRIDRCFIGRVACPKIANNVLAAARKHLFYECREFQGRIKGNDKLADSQVQEGREILKQVFPVACKPLLNVFLTRQASTEYLSALAKFFRLLSAESDVINILPLDYVQSVKEYIAKIQSGNTTVTYQFLDYCSFFCPELQQVVSKSCNDELCRNPSVDAISTILFLADLVEKVHQKDTQLPPAVPIKDSYNPPKLGRAYYFRKDGRQVRIPRGFGIDMEKIRERDECHDDCPEFEDCSKKYPKVSRRGRTQLYLTHCAEHGHCYGFHLIKGSEGRKDPYYSLLLHLEKPPTDVWYDFCCAFHEYCMNRENGYWNRTRFFHDEFHGYNHKCSNVFSASRLRGFEGTNSEICEQFNAFAQKIKKTSYNLSQVHFIFYLQFMIRHWNEKKRLKHIRAYKYALDAYVDDLPSMSLT